MKRQLPHWIRLGALLIALVLAGGAPALAQHEGHSEGAPAASGLQTQVGPYRVAAATDPAVIPVGKANLRLTVADASGQPVEGAQVRAIAQMPGMNMGEREVTAQPQPGQAGVYLAPISFAMAGGYVATLTISGPQGQGKGTLSLQTGQNTGAASGAARSAWWLWAGGLALVAFVIYRMRRTGQRLHWRGVFTRPVLGGLAVLGLMLAVAVFAVNRWRRPGAMTPLEAQGMEMSMPAPPGTMPVELATARRGAVQNKVRYTGQAVGYVQQDVYPRVTGNLLWMPFYAGDRVKKDQLLARLDTSQIEPQIAQQRAAQSMAQQNALSAQGQYRQAIAGISQARAEGAAKRGAIAEAISQERKARAEIGSRLGQLAEAHSGERKARATAGGSRSGVEEARSAERRAGAALQEATAAVRSARGASAEAQSDLTAAREERTGAETDLEAAQTQVADAAAQFQAAQADQEYWTKEIERMRVLVKEGAVSREEFQREQAQAENAAAKVRQAQARVAQVGAAVRGAQSRIRRADALARGAAAKAQQAQAALEGSQSRIEGARADIVGAGARVRQAQATSQGAGADISGASARIRQMEEDVRAARAEAVSASARVQQARAEWEASQSGIRAAQAQADAAQGGIGQAQAGVAQARAGVASATTTRGYTAIRSLVDGVVTQRLISPGTLVQPGQAILQVAQISPIRLQANVAEADLKRVRVGSPITIRDQSGEGKGRALAARVASVAPAVDPQTRTGLVEAIAPNTDRRFVPGEYVVMEIETGRSISNLSVPSIAIQQRGAASGGILSTQSQPFVWVAEPVAGQPHGFTVQQVEVRTGVSDGAQTEIVSGLREGQRVVTAGYQYLKNGDSVATANAVVANSGAATPEQEHGAEASAVDAQTARVTVTERGFEPASVPLRAGVAARVTFERKTEATCATAVVFPDFKIKRELPLNKPVVIAFTPQKNGEIVFGCGMDMMLRGKVMVR